jgi:hypothetical protein
MEVSAFEDGFMMHEKNFKLQQILAIFESMDQNEWGEFFSSSKSYFIKPAILVKKAAEVEFKIKDLTPMEETEEQKNDKKKELENMIL